MNYAISHPAEVQVKDGKFFLTIKCINILRGFYSMIGYEQNSFIYVSIL